MIATGTVVEVGQLEDEDGALGFIIQHADGRLITVKGLTADETRTAAALLFGLAVVMLAPGAETPP